MIKTTHGVKLQINSNVFNIQVDEINTKSMKILNDLKDTQGVKYSEADKTSALIKKLQKDYDLNAELLKEKSLKNRVQVIEEQKQINNNISDLQQLLEKQKKSISLFDDAEEFHQKMFDLRVSGKDKERLEDVISDLGISYTKIMGIIDAEMIKAIEKK